MAAKDPKDHSRTASKLSKRQRHGLSEGDKSVRARDRENTSGNPNHHENFNRLLEKMARSSE